MIINTSHAPRSAIALIIPPNFIPPNFGVLLSILGRSRASCAALSPFVSIDRVVIVCTASK